MRTVGIFALILGALALAVGVFILGVWVLVWNLTDIENVGFNFWNVFWIVLASMSLLGGISATSRRSS